MKYRWLCLSDTHIFSKSFKNELLIDKLNTFLKKENKVDFIVVLGDLMYKNEYDNNIFDLTNILKDKIKNYSPHKLIILPGNHDYARTKKRDTILNNFYNNPHDKTIQSKLLNIGLEKFSKLYFKILKTEYHKKPIEHYHINNDINATCINSSLLSNTTNDANKLFITPFLQPNENNNPTKLNLLFMHHSSSFFDDKESLLFQNWIDDNGYDLVFVGHNHKIQIYTYNNTYSQVQEFTCGSLYPDDYSDLSFFICEYDDIDLHVNLKLISYVNNKNEWEIDTQKLRCFHTGKMDIYLDKLKPKNIEDKDKEINIKFEKIKKNNDRSEPFSGYKYINDLVKIGIPNGQAKRILNKLYLYISNLKSETISYNIIRDFTIEELYLLKKESTTYDIIYNKYLMRYAHKDVPKLIYYNKEKYNLSYSNIKKLLSTVFKEQLNINTSHLPTSELDSLTDETFTFLRDIVDCYKIDFLMIGKYLFYVNSKQPHPAFVTEFNKTNIFEYNINKFNKHLNKFDSNRNRLITISELIYHSTCYLLLNYNIKYIGKQHISPIIILYNELKKINEDSLLTVIEKRKLLRDLRIFNGDTTELQRYLKKIIHFSSHNNLSDIDKDIILKYSKFINSIKFNNKPTFNIKETKKCFETFYYVKKVVEVAHTIKNAVWLSLYDDTEKIFACYIEDRENLLKVSNYINKSYKNFPIIIIYDKSKVKNNYIHDFVKNVLIKTDKNNVSIFEIAQFIECYNNDLNILPNIFKKQ